MIGQPGYSKKWNPGKQWQSVIAFLFALKKDVADQQNCQRHFYTP